MPLSRVIPYALPEAPWRSTPLLGYALLMMLGIGGGWTLKDSTEPWIWLLLAAVAAIATALLYRRFQGQRDKRFLVWIGGAIAVVFSAATLLSVSYRNVKTEWPEKEQVWTGRIAGVHKQKENGASVDVRLTEGEQPYAGHTVRLYLQGEETRNLQPGAPIAFQSVIRGGNPAGNPGDFDYAAYLLTHGISGQGFVRENEWKSDTATVQGGWLTTLLHVRKKLVARYADFFDGRDLEILSALTLGEKSLLQTDTRDLFSETGTSHILALSGLHLGILFSLLNLLFLKRIRRRWLRIAANLLTLFALWNFVLMVGAPLSLIRAAVMFSLLQVANAIRREQNVTLNNLSFAAIIILLWQPMSLLDVGFQLSFCSVFAIVIAGEFLWQRFPLPEWVDDKALVRTLHPKPGRIGFLKYFDSHFLARIRYSFRRNGYLFFRSTLYPTLCVSLTAQLGTAPLVVYYFHIFPTYALLANLFVVPIAYCLLGGALLFFLVPIDIVQQAVACVLRLLLLFMQQALSFISGLPCAYFKLYPSALTLLALALIPALLYALHEVRSRRTRLRLIYAITALLLLGIGCETYQTYTRRVTPQIVFYKLSRSTNVHFIRSAEESYLYTTIKPDSIAQRFAYIQKNYFEPNHISPPRLLTKQTERYNHLSREGNFFLFGEKRLYLLNHSLQGKTTQRPIPVDLLLVAYKCWNTPQEVLTRFKPTQIVLDNSLPYRLKSDWQTYCRQAAIPCHDLYSQGAFVLKLYEKE